MVFIDADRLMHEDTTSQDIRLRSTTERSAGGAFPGSVDEFLTDLP